MQYQMPSYLGSNMEYLRYPSYSSCSTTINRSKAQRQLSIVILLLCTITSSWGMDIAQDGEDVLKILDSKTPASSEVQCWMIESFTTQGPCQACDEHAMKYASYCCNETGFRQLVRCESYQSPVYKSCPKSKWAMEKSFWTFEGVMLAVGLSSFVVVMFRRRALDWEALQRVKKQIANSV